MKRKWSTLAKRILAMLLVVATVVTTDSSSFINAYAMGYRNVMQNDISGNGLDFDIEPQGLGFDEIEPEGADVPSLLINARSTVIGEKGFADPNLASVMYRSDWKVSATNFEHLYYLSAEDKDDSNHDWIHYDMDNPPVIEPGNYYLYYTDSNGDDHGFDAFCYGVKVATVDVYEPTDVAWKRSGSDMTMVASWTAPTKAKNDVALDTGVVVAYEVQLYKDDVALGSAVSPANPSDTEYDFTSVITENGYGDYTFKVLAKTPEATQHYSASPYSEASDVYDYKDTIQPEIFSFAIGTDEKADRFVATAKDNVGISKYAFSTATSAADVAADEWKSVNAADVAEDGLVSLESATITTSGVYYLYVMDADDNVMDSKSAKDAGALCEDYIPATVVKYYATMSGSAKNKGLDTETPSQTQVILGEEIETTSTDLVENEPASVSGYDFIAWYDNASFTGDYVAKIKVNTTTNDYTLAEHKATIKAGEDYSLYAKYTGQDYNVLLSTNKADNKMTYDGTSDGKGMTMAASVSNKIDGKSFDYDSITYKWYKKVSDGDDVLLQTNVKTKSDSEPTVDHYQINKVADSADYYVVVTIHVEDTDFESNSNQITATIEKATLTLQLKDVEIQYLDEAPASFEYKDEVTGLVDGESLDTLQTDGLFAYGDIETDYHKGDAITSADHTYKITQGTNKASAANYKVVVTDGELIVHPRKSDAATSGVYLTFAQNAEGNYPLTYNTTYTGEAKTPAVVVWQKADINGAMDPTNDTQLAAANIKEVTYADNVNAGEATVTVTLQGNYESTLSLTFTIDPATNGAVLKMVQNGTSNVSTSPKWTYGDTANAYTPTVDSNPSQKAPIYYFCKAAEGETVDTVTFDKSSCTKTQPVDAGVYFAWALIPTDGNYQEFTTNAVVFEIEKRKITLTANSHEWVYDGKNHSDTGYTMEPSTNAFAEGEGFNSVASVAQSTVKDYSETPYVNKIEYSLTPTTKADNYDITLIDGELKIKKITLSAPDDMHWLDGNDAGGLYWTPISQENLTVTYTVKIYREGNMETPITTVTGINADTYNFHDVILNDTKTNGVSGYVATIEVIPSGGLAVTDYDPSAPANATFTLYSQKVTLSLDETIDNASDKSYLIDQQNNKDTSAYLIGGEYLSVRAESKPGYWGPNLTAKDNDVVTSDVAIKDRVSYGYNDAMGVDRHYTVGYIHAELNATKASNTVMVCANAGDRSPRITSFNAVNNTENGYHSVSLSFEVFDVLGLEGYKLIKDENSDVPLKSFSNAPDGYRYSETIQITEPGTYYLYVKDKGGSYTSTTDSYYDDITTVKSKVIVYEIKFDKEDGATGTDMAPVYKVANSSIVLPECTYEKTGYSFKNWEGTDAAIYADKDAYSANLSNTLTAKFSEDEYAYTVQYFYQNLDGTYPETPSETKTLKGGFNKNVTNQGELVKNNKTGFAMNQDEAKKETITLGGDENPVLHVYYDRNQYKITYKYQNPTTKEDVTHEDTYVYGQDIATYTLAETYPGYTFAGWDFGDFDISSQTTMPAKNLTVEGSFTADKVDYIVVNYLQNVPAQSGDFIYGGTEYAETPSDQFTKASETSYASTQGTTITAALSGDSDTTHVTPAKYEGFTVKGVVVSTSNPFGGDLSGNVNGVTSSNLKTTGSGTVDAENKLYICYYYERNIYNITLGVFKDKRDVDANRMFQKTWSVSYGAPLTSNQTAQIETYGYHEKDYESAASYNHWIVDACAAGGVDKSTIWNTTTNARTEAFSSYKLAEYTDWSSGDKPTTMPAGNVNVTKEYVEHTTSDYKIQLYLENVAVDVSNGKYTYPNENDPTYLLLYNDSIGYTVQMQDATPAKERDNDNKTITLSYTDILKNLTSDYGSYEFDTEKADNVTSGVILADKDKAGNDVAPMVLKVYFKRKVVKTHVTYYYVEGDKNKEIASYDYSAQWGTKYNFYPTAYFNGTGSTDFENKITTWYGANADNISNFKFDETYKDKNFNAEACSISYRSYYYFVSSGSHYDPSTVWKTQDAYTNGQTQVTTMGQKDSGAYTNYVRIYYTRLDVDKTVYKKLSYSENGNTLVGETQGENNFVIKKGEDVLNINIDEIRVANKRDIFTSTKRDLPTAATYKAANVHEQSNGYTYGTLKPNYTAVTVTTSDGTDTYYLEQSGDKNILYMIDTKNRLFEGNDLMSFAFDSSADIQNGAHIGKANANEIMKSNHPTGYAMYAQSSYDIVHSNGTMQDGGFVYYYTKKIDDRYVNYTYNGRTHSIRCDYDSTYVVAEDASVATVFPAAAGYQIVWYTSTEYTTPIGTSYKMTQNYYFYGQLEKMPVSNYNYAYFELSDSILAVDDIKSKALEADGRYYITKDQIDDFAWGSTVGGLELKMEETTVPSKYTNEKGIEINYYAKVVEYSIGHDIVMVEEENKTISFSTVSLNFKELVDLTGESKYGYAYDERDTKNKTKGYCQSEGIELCAYNYRKNFTQTLIKPSAGHEQYDDEESTLYKFGQKMTLPAQTRTGYVFNGWKVSRENADGTYTELSAEELAKFDFVYNTTDKITTYTMPSFNIKVEAKFVAGTFDYDVISYFQDKDGGYPTASMDAILAAEENGNIASSRFFEYQPTKGDAQNLTGTYIYADTAKSTLIAVSYDETVDGKTYSYYFAASNADVAGGKAVVKAPQLVGAKQTVQVTTAVADNAISDIILPNEDSATGTLFGIYSYAFTSHTYKGTTTNYNKSGTYTSYADMTLVNYYVRLNNYEVRTFGVSLDSTADAISDNGLTLVGDGNSFGYGEEVTLEATVSAGYEFVGWYKVSDVYGDTYTGFDQYADKAALVNAFKTIDIEGKPFIALSDTTISGEDIMYPKDELGNNIYRIKVILEENTDYVAVTKPTAVGEGVSETIASGCDDYTYGYADDTTHYLQSKVTIADAQKSYTSITKYEWHKYSFDAETNTYTDLGTITDGNGPILLIGTGLDAGDYYYDCWVTVKNTNNNRTTVVKADAPKKLTVKQYGLNPSVTGQYYHGAQNYVDYYDAANHSICVRIENEKNSALAPNSGKYKIYYSASPIATWDAVTSGLDTTVFEGSYTGNRLDNTVPDSFQYKDVLLDDTNNVASRTVYYYIRTDEAGLDPNYADQWGSATVKIHPVELNLTRTLKAFSKIYDASEAVKGDPYTIGSDFYRLINGEDIDGQHVDYYSINNATFAAEKDGLTISLKAGGSATFNTKHVDGSKSVTLSGLQVVSKSDQNVVNNNFIIPNSVTLSGYIKPYTLHIKWKDEDTFVYDGTEKAVEVEFTDPAAVYPDPDLSLVSLGKQIHVGTYKASASLDTTGKSYQETDYTFDISTKEYKIIKCPITLQPKAAEKTYNATEQTLDTFEIYKDTIAKDVNSATGACDNLSGTDYIKMALINTDASHKDAGSYEIKVASSSVKIFNASGMEVTFDYDITYAPAILTIAKQKVTISGVGAENKIYDGLTNATLKTTQKTLSSGDKEVLSPVVFTMPGTAQATGIYPGDELYVLAAATSNANFADANVGNAKTVTFDLASTDVFVGASAANYELDAANSTKTSSANITKKQIVVTVKSLPDTVYGVTPSYAVEYSGFENGESADIITGAPSFLLNGVNYETASYQYSYSDKNSATVSGTKIPCKDDPYIIRLELNDDDTVKGLSTANYDIVSNAEQDDAKVTIVKRPIKVVGINRATTITKQYDATTSVLTDLVSGCQAPIPAVYDYDFEKATALDSTITNNASGLLDGDVVSVTFDKAYNSKDVATANKILATNVAISLAYLDASKNYTLVNDTFEVKGVITKAPLTITVSNQEIIYGDAAPSYQATATGWIKNEASNINEQKNITASMLTFACDYDTNNASKRHVGTYDIKATNDSFTDTNYEANVTKGTLTVKKKEITLSVEDVTKIYGKETVSTESSAYTGTSTGWVSAYGDSATSVCGTTTKTYQELITANIKYKPEDKPDGALEYPYCENGYTIEVEGIEALNSAADSGNYSFQKKTGKLNIVKSYISVSGITVADTVDASQNVLVAKGKYYDNTDTATIAYDPTSMKFGCFVSGEGNHEYTAENLFKDLIAGYDTMTDDAKKAALTQKIKDNFVITGTYTNKNVGNGITVNLAISIKPNSYIDQRYTLIAAGTSPADLATLGVENASPSQGFTSGNIAKRPVTLQVYYKSQTGDKKVKYGDEIVPEGYGFNLIAGSYASGENFDNLGIQIEYSIVDLANNLYTKTSGAGTYFVKAQIGGTVNPNYDLTVVGSIVDATHKDTSIVVHPNQLETPSPKWSTTKPGTVTFDRVPNIGNVEVDHYDVKVYKDGNSTAIKEDTVLYDASKATYEIDYESLIRTNGAGKYEVCVQALSKVSDDYNPMVNGEKKNVLDSKVSTKVATYAATVQVAYATDSITSNAATSVGASPDIASNAGKESSITIKDDTHVSYLVISGQTVPVTANWYNAKGYTTGYSVNASTGLNAAYHDNQSAFTGCTFSVADDQSKTGQYKANAKIILTSDRTVDITLALTKRAATVVTSVDTAQSVKEAVYGYAPANANKVVASTAPSSTDNVTKELYDYAYVWTYKKSTEDATKFVAVESQSGTPEHIAFFKEGMSQGTYNVKYTVTATRKDNGESATKTVSYNVKVKKATISDDIGEATVLDWQYGSARNVPSIRATYGAIPAASELGTIHYYFSTDAGDNKTWTEWTATTAPENVGTYYLYATVDANDNYESFNTLQHITTFAITQNKLGLKDLSEPSSTLSTTDLSMTSSGKAAYGHASWPCVANPKENTDSTTNYITPSYEVILYRYDLNADPSTATKVKTYDAADVTISSGTCVLDMADQMNQKGNYFYTVQAISDQQTNCADSDVVKSNTYTVADHLQAKDVNNQELLSDTDYKYLEYTYDAQDVTLYLPGSYNNATFQWYQDGNPISGATAQEYKVRYVTDSAKYSCVITYTNGTKQDTSYVDVTIKPRTITIVTGSASKDYDGTALTKDEWWIKEDETSPGVASTSGTSADSLTESKTSNTVTGVLVTGTKTTTSLDAQNQVIGEDNTVDLDSIVIKEGTKDVYTKALADANQANYKIETAPGTLTITNINITITSGTDEKVYDGTALTKHTASVTVGSLLAGDSIDVAGMTFTGTLTDVAYDASSQVTTVENTYTESTVKIKNATNDDVTSCYNITFATGTLKVTPFAYSATDILTFMNDANATTKDYNWTGNDITPVIRVEDGRIQVGDPAANKVLTLGTDYTLSGDTTKMPVGTYSVNVNLKGNYAGTIPLTWKINDVVAPTGKIQVGTLIENIFNTLKDVANILFDKFFNVSQTITIEAKEENGGSGIEKVSYYVYEKTSDAAANGLTESDLNSLADANWTELSTSSITNGEKGSFTLTLPANTEKKVVIYTKLSDKAGHVTYLSSDGIILENIAPTITGVEDGKTYCIEATIIVNDTYLDSLTINGTERKQDLSVDGKLTLTPSSTPYTIVAKDKAGNTKTISNVTVNDWHTFTFTGNGTDTLILNCSVDTCDDYHNTNKIYASIAASDATYDGLAHGATVATKVEGVANDSLLATFEANSKTKVGSIKYYSVETYGATTGGTNMTSTAPINAGFYYAEAEIVSGPTGSQTSYYIRKAFKISPAEISLTISPTEFEYDETSHGPTSIVVKATVNGSEVTLTEGADYTITATDISDSTHKIATSATAIGTYYVQVKGKGNYTGTKEQTFVIKDTTKPTVTGVTNGAYYCENQSISIYDLLLDKVIIKKEVLDQNGYVTGTTYEGGSADGILVNGQKTYTNTLTGTKYGTRYTIDALDSSNNHNEVMKVTVYAGHDFDVDHDGEDDWTDVGSGRQKKTCWHSGCGYTLYRYSRQVNIKWNFKYGYLDENNNYQEDVVSPDNRINGAIVVCYQKQGANIVEFDRKYVATNNSTSEIVEKNGIIFENLPETDENGNPYTYEMEVYPANQDTDQMEDVAGYTTEQKKIYSSDGLDAFEINVSSVIGFDLYWQIHLTDLPKIDGVTAYPEQLFVKVYFDNYLKGQSSYEGDYDVTDKLIQQQAGSKGAPTHYVSNNNGVCTYEGNYNVWKTNTTGNYSSYKIRVTGYLFNGVYYDVDSSVDYLSDDTYNGANNIGSYASLINGTTYEKADDNSYGVQLIHMDIDNLAMPMLVFDKNEGTDTTNTVTLSVDHIQKPALGDPVSTAEISAVTATRDHYEFAGWYDAPTGGNQVTEIASLAGTVTLYAHWIERVKPFGTISIKEDSYTEFLNTVTFGHFFNKTNLVTIGGADTGFENGVQTGVENSGIDKIYYYLSHTALTETEVADPSIDWTEYTAPFGIEPDGEYVVYAKVVDKAGNLRYISSDGMNIHSDDPVITGIEDQKTYCEAQTFFVDDAYLDKVYVNDVLVTVDASGYELAAENKTYVIRAVDKAGNETVYTVKVNNGHDYNDPIFDWSEDYSTCKATFICKADASHIKVEMMCDITKTQTIIETIEEDGEITYVATVIFQGKTYTDKKKKTVDKLPPKPTTPGVPYTPIVESTPDQEIVLKHPYKPFVWEDLSPIVSDDASLIDGREDEVTLDDKQPNDRDKGDKLDDKNNGSLTDVTSGDKGQKDHHKTGIHCFWHWWILILSICELILIIGIIREKEEDDEEEKALDERYRKEREKKAQKLTKRLQHYRSGVIIVATVGDIIFVILGFCWLDLPFAIVGTLVSLIAYFVKKKIDGKREQIEYKEQ